MSGYRAFYEIDHITYIFTSSITKKTAVIIALSISDRVREHWSSHLSLLNCLLVVSFVFLNYIRLTNPLLSIYFSLVVFNDCFGRFVLILSIIGSFRIGYPEWMQLTVFKLIPRSLRGWLGYCIFRRLERTGGTNSSDMTSFLLNTRYKVWIDFKHEHPWIDLVQDQEVCERNLMQVVQTIDWIRCNLFWIYHFSSKLSHLLSC